MAAYHTDIDEVTAAVVQLRRDFHTCCTLAEQAAIPARNAFAQLLTVRLTNCRQLTTLLIDPYPGS